MTGRGVRPDTSRAGHRSDNYNRDENSFERIETHPDTPGPTLNPPGRVFAVLHALLDQATQLRARSWSTTMWPLPWCS
ncbi:MAG: hypothetical protein AAFQ65_07575 [Myxococcota bacterium]